jgi:polyisoprenyl-teichoic acid--peptidoglycan teichoic acid transferase
MKTPAERQSVRAKSTSAFWRVLRLTLLLIFLCGALFSGFVAYDFAHGWFDLIDDPSESSPFPTVPPESPDQSGPNATPAIDPTTGAIRAPIPSNGGPSGSPPSASQAQTAQAWDHRGRVNILLMGVDLRPGEKGPTNTDALIIVTIDPATRSVGMLSIPRDLWVPIPGSGENRINTAYWSGVRRGYPGGGPALVKKTIQLNFGIPIHYYALINFVGFRKLVDVLGGLTIDVPHDISDPTFPNDTYGVKPLFIPKGKQHMNGQMALDYARTRHADTDFGRMKRQQQVLMAIKDQALRVDVIPKIPALWVAKDNLAQTDLGLTDVFALVQLAREIKSDSITTGLVGDAETQDWTTSSGAMVLLPNPGRIQKVIEKVFSTPPSAAAAALQPGEQFKSLSNEAARIEIVNGSKTGGLAGRVAEWLKAQGFSVTLVDAADRDDYAQTVIVDGADKSFTRALALNLMRLPADHWRRGATGKPNVDMRIVIGQDFDLSLLPTSQ